MHTFLMVNQMISMGPMPENPLNIGENVYINKEATKIQNEDLFNKLQFYWPSSINPPYTLPEGCIWSWNDEEDERIWCIVSLF